MCSTYYDRPAFWNSEDVKARKPHKCCECGREIAVGEVYRRASGKWDYGVNTFKTCRHCCVGQDWLNTNCHGFMHEGLSEEMQEHIEDNPRIALGLRRIRFGISRGWKRLDGTGLMRVQPMPKPINHENL